MISFKYAYIYLYIISLLSLLPMVAEGQTSASYQGNNRSVPYVKMQRGHDWKYVLWKGGLLRSARGDLYMDMTDGINELAGFNFVDGYTLGPHLTFGKMQRDRSRWELEETVRWAFSREALIAKGALRWYSAVEKGIMLEAYGGRYSDDYDPAPLMSAAERELTSVLFAWNHFKLLERRDAGLRLVMPLNNDLSLDLKAGWEWRDPLENHRKTNLFGAHPQDNVPRTRKADTPSDLSLYEGPVKGELAKAGLELTYRPKSQHLVYDDLYCATQSDYPQVSLRADMGMGSWKFVALDLRVAQTLRWKPIAEFSYEVGAGTVWKKGDLGLADWHHFDASRFWWQGSRRVTHFALLDNYELSTDQRWAEAHAEFSSHRFLLNWLLPHPGLIAEYVQGHFVTVPDRPAHWEMHYGIDLLNVMRLGVALGGDNNTFRGAAFVMTLNLFELSKL